MAHIVIRYSDLTETATAIKKNIQTYQSLIHHSKSIVFEISSSWSGKASESFVHLLNQYIYNANKMVDLLEQFVKINMDVSRNFKKVDSSCAKMINDSF